MKKSILRLSAFFVLLGASFLGCDNVAEDVKDDRENTIREKRGLNRTDHVYLTDIENYRIEAGKTIDLNSQKITAYKLNIDTKREKCKYDYRQSILKLELQNTYMEIILDGYEPEGKEKWEIFKAAHAYKLVELTAEFAGFSKGNKHI